MKKYRVVCIDDDEQFLASLANSLPNKVAALCRDFECSFEFAASPEELFEMLASSSNDPPLAMVISDQIMPKMSGIEVIEKLKQDHPDMMAVLLTGYGGMESAKYAINHALLNQYVSKPIEDLQEFASLTANLLKCHHLDLEERQRTAELAATIESLRVSNEQIALMKAAAEQVAMLSKGLKSLDFEEVVDLVCHKVPKMFGARKGALCFAPTCNVSDIVKNDECVCAQTDLGMQAKVSRAVREGHVLFGDATTVCCRLGGQTPQIIIPLTINAGVITDGDSCEGWPGYLCMCDIEEAPSSMTELLAYKAELVSEILSVTLTNAKLYQKAKQDSEVDFLTGVSSRRVLEERLQAECDRAYRYDRAFCLAMIDVDQFKTVNDEYGHSVGDETLRHLARIIGEEIRKTDLLARFGGDEFVILMPETKLSDAIGASERIRAHAELGLARQGKAITISCGVAEWSSEECKTPIDLVRRADAALYQAKRAGRNRVETMTAE